AIEAVKTRILSRQENTHFSTRHEHGNLTICQPTSCKRKCGLTCRTSSLGQLRRLEYSKDDPVVHMFRRTQRGMERPQAPPHSFSMNRPTPTPPRRGAFIRACHLPSWEG